MAINGHLGIQSQAYAQAVLDNFNAAVAGGGSNDQIKQRIINAIG